MKFFTSLFACLFVLLSMNAFAVEPTVQAYNLAFTNVEGTQMRVVFTRGNGEYRILVAKQTPTPGTLSNPADGSDYTANANFGDGSNLGSNTFVVYEGTNRAVTVTGLTPGLSYTFKAFEFNGTGTATDYRTSSASNNPRTIITPADGVSGLTVANTNDNSFEARWNSPLEGVWDSYQLQVATDSAFTSPLSDYNNLSIGKENDPEPFFTIEDLYPNTQYFWRVRTTYGGGFTEWVNYGSPTAVVTTPIAPTVSNATICTGSTYTITPSAPSPSTHSFKFYTSATGSASLVGSGTSFTTPALTDASTIYYVSSVNTATGLESVSRTALTVSTVAYPLASVSGDALVCNGQEDVAYSTAAHAGNTYAWTVTGGTVASGAGTNSILVDWNTPGTGSVAVLETNATGCSDTASFDVTIQSIPGPAITGSSALCVNTEDVMYFVPQTVNNLLWTVSGGTITGSNTNDTIFVDWNTAGAGSVTVNESTSGGCTATTVYNVAVDSYPDPNILGPTSVCSNQALVPYKTTLHAGNTYAWTVTGGTIAGEATTDSIAVNWGDNGTGTVALAETNANGCLTRDTAIVQINPLANTDITGTLGVCASQSGLVYSTTTSNASNTYAWTVTGGTITAGAGTPAITVRWGVAGTGKVEVTETMPSGCQTYHSHDITINALPSAAITGVRTLCVNTSADYSADLHSGSTYVWSVTRGTITPKSNVNEVSVLWNQNGTGVLTLTETNESGCSTTVTYNVTVQALPTPTIEGNAHLCVNSANEVYTAPLVAGNVYNWTVIGGTITNNSAVNSITVTWPEAGQHSVSVVQTNTNGCSMTATLDIEVQAYPTPEVTGDNTACLNSSKSYSVELNGDDEYLWSVNGGRIIDGQNTNRVTVEWITPGVNSVSILQMTAAGCTTEAEYETFVYGIPSPEISGNGDVLEFDANVAYSTENVENNTYFWTVSGGEITGGQNTAGITVTWGPAGEGLVSVIETTPDGCSIESAKDVTVNRGSICKLAIITEITKRVSGTPFIVKVQAQTANGTPTTVTANTNIVLSVNSGSGTVTGSGIIMAGTSETEISATYDNIDGDVNVVISADDGPNGLSAAVSNQFDVYACEPSQSSNIVWGTVTRNSIAISWTNGGGSGRVVSAKESSSFSSADNLTDGRAYTANPAFGSGDQVGGSRVVYKGNGSSVTVTGLQSMTRYCFKVFEYHGNDANGTINYNINAVSNNPRSRLTARVPGSGQDYANISEDGSFFMSEISPNPAKEKIHFDLEMAEESAVTVRVTTIDGKTVLSPINGLTIGKGITYPVDIPVEKLTAGTYLILVSAGDQMIMDKVVILP